MSVAWVVRPFAVVIVSSVTAFVAALWLGRRFLTGSSPLRERIVLTSRMTPEQGYVGQQPSLPDLIGRTGTVTAVLRPSGKVLVDGTYYEAVAEDGLYIERGTVVEIVRAEGGLLYCRRAAGQA